LSGVAWLLTPKPVELSPTPSPVPGATATVTPTPTASPGPTATTTASATPSSSSTPVPTISLQPTGGRVGTAVVITGRGWRANETLSLGLLGSTSRLLWDAGTASTDGQGNLTAGFVFPANWVGASAATVLVRSGDGNRNALAIFQVTGQATSTPLPPLIITGWLGQYYNNILLTGDPVLVRNDNDIDFDWGSHSPMPGVVNDQRFSVQWTRTMYFPAGDYRFWAEADDGIRLWLDDHPIIDEWHLATSTQYSGDVYNLGEGLHTIRVEFYQDAGAAHVHVWWQQIPPTPTNTPTNTPTTTPVPSSTP
jgi:hypothetical protein